MASGQETLGAETHLTVACGNALLRLRSPGFLEDVTGKDVRLAVPARALRLFHAESGRAC